MWDATIKELWRRCKVTNSYTLRSTVHVGCKPLDDCASKIDGGNSYIAPFVNATSSCANLSGSQSNTQGIIESNQISTTYTNDMDCQWNIYSNAALELAFHRFNTERCCDYVRVYNGGSAFSPLIGRFSGSSLPAPITTLSNGLRVRFTSDNSRTYQGFDARYRVLHNLANFTTNGRKGRFGTIQTFSIPRTAHYFIKAWGARGGTHSYNYGYNPGTYYGGKGAFKMGTFRLTKGTVLNIVMGQRGGDSVEVKGGQSTTRTAAELGLSLEDNAAAGGGGGASGGYNGVHGQVGTNGTSSVGKDSSKVRKGGTGGQPGECNTAGGNYHGGVGAGWFSQGCDRKGPEHGERGGSRAQGWIGGQAGATNSGNNGGPAPGAVGGFGGGGGGSEDNGASGGGGGYSGGGSGIYENQAGGGGVRIVVVTIVLV
ncbi:hypothetical protein OS493_013276 [Desmophyllum pertusum]|uniref:CUB domain-containing protein n=1 Tax=Desmophyllum pertusum TaxID=174260 RepID=A0A9X0CKU9_9CNID|nr:hypothetical protein OS493_013276 [Desmophyllum pertusum]